MTEITLSKRLAMELFGGTQAALADALGITRSAVSVWPEVLTPRQRNEVLGAALVLGRIRHRNEILRLDDAFEENGNGSNH